MPSRPSPPILFSIHISTANFFYTIAAISCYNISAASIGNNPTASLTAHSRTKTFL